MGEQNQCDLNLKIQEEISNYFSGPRQNYILTPDEVVINYDEFFFNSIMNTYERLDSKLDDCNEIEDAGLIIHIANIFIGNRNVRKFIIEHRLDILLDEVFGKLETKNTDSEIAKYKAKASRISYETLKCLIVYLINLSHKENYSIKENSNRFLKCFKDLIDYYRLILKKEKEIDEYSLRTTLDSMQIIYNIVPKLFKKYKEFDFKLYKDCCQVGKVASFYYRHLQNLSDTYNYWGLEKAISHLCEERGIKLIRKYVIAKHGLNNFFYIRNDIECICKKNAIMYIELENICQDITGFHDMKLFELKLVLSFYNQTMDILNNKDPKKIADGGYRYHILSELWYPEVILKAIEDHHQQSEPRDFETSLRNFLQICPTFEFLLIYQSEFKDLFPQSKDLARIFKEIKQNAIRDECCIFVSEVEKQKKICNDKEVETHLITKIIHKTYDAICPDHKTNSIEDIHYRLPAGDIGSFLKPFYEEQRKESMENTLPNKLLIENGKKFFEAVFEARKKYFSQEGEILHPLLYFDWDSNLFKDYHEEICELFKYYTNSMMKTESLFAYYCVLRKKVSVDNFKILSDMMQLRWKAEKNFMRFLLESTVLTLLTDVEIDFIKIKDDIEKLPLVFFLAFLKVFLFFSQQDFFYLELRINQEKCIDVFVRTLEYFPSLKKIFVNTEEHLFWFPTLYSNLSLNLSTAMFRLIQKYEKNIPYERLELVFEGYWGGVFAIKEKLRIEQSEKSSLKEIKNLGEGFFAYTQLVETKNSPIPQVAKCFKDNLSDQIRNEVATLLSLQGNPHVVDLYGFITDDHKIVGILMEYCEGGSLFDYISSPAVYNMEDIIFWTSQAAAGLLFLHKNGVIHRDVKPANLLLDVRHKILKVADVGISKPSISPYSRHNREYTNIYGTSGYAAPEANRTQTTYSVDVYSLGRTVWHMIYRDYPSNEKIDDLIANENNDKYPRAVTVSSELIDFNIIMMEENMLNRPQMVNVYHYFKHKIVAENSLKKQEKRQN